MNPKRTLAIGVTGGIGSGKSEVCAIFKSLGGIIYSSDAIAKEVMNTDPRLKKRITTLCGSSIYRQDGALDKKAMAKLIFTDDLLKVKINAIVHPVVIKYLDDVIQSAKISPKISLMFIESALIYDAGIQDLFDYIILVLSSEETSVNRVLKRDGISKSEVQARRSAQAPPEQHREKADFTIDNTGDLQSLKNNCEFLYSILTKLN
ncbi:MAG: dephospho-CoA kinase [Bacteroidota bacterium]